ncbi:MAG: BamA/OMP85 family outer membrane protein [Chitinophagaceae bacterium]
MLLKNTILTYHLLRFAIYFLSIIGIITPLYAQNTTTIAIPKNNSNTIDSSESIAILNKDSISPKNTIDKKNISFSYPPQSYIVADIQIIGNHSMEDNFIASIAGFQKGAKIMLPSDRISKAINSLWKQNMFSDIELSITKVENDSIWVTISIEERPVLSEYQIKGVRKGERESLSEKFQLKKGRVVTESMLKHAEDEIIKFFVDKGFYETKVTIQEILNKQQTAEKVIISINKGVKVHINDIVFYGNNQVPDYQLKGKMKDTREYIRLTLFPPKDSFVYGKPVRITFKEFIKNFAFFSPTKTYLAASRYARLINLFYSSKFIENKYTDDLDKIISYYNNLGYRDAQIIKDTQYLINNRLINIEIQVNEGNKYYFGNIVFKGNTIYKDSLLQSILGIKKGDPYNLELLNKKLGKQASPDGSSYDISTLYMDNGYLFFQVNPVETRIYNDTIDYEIRIQEGTIATIKHINIIGNDRTKEHIIRREIRILPGDKFSKTELIRSIRDIANLGYFNQDKINPVPIPNLNDGTVDINLSLEEKSSDQLELSLGWGGFYGLTGTIGVTFNNFSVQNLFNKKAWKPLPTGDGQRFSVRAQLNGKYFYSFSGSFTQFWLGNRKRNSFTIAASFTHNTYGASGFLSTVPSLFNADSSFLTAVNVSAIMSNPLSWPDDYFIVDYGLNYTYYNLKNYPITAEFSNGIANSINLQLGLRRSSIDQPVFPRSGSSFNLTAKFTPPYSLFNKNINYNKWIEFHKWRFNADWYLPITPTYGEDKNMQVVLRLAVKFGFLGRYSTNLPYSAFERFQLGDAGLMGAYGGILGYDIVSQRGYPVYRTSDPYINPENDTRSLYFTLFNKYSAELRIPFVLSTSSTIYGQIFYEMANGWYSLQEWNPFQLRKDVGVGVRFMLPALGLIGFDYTLGIDRLSSVSLGSAFRFSFILGFEPE